MRYRSKRTRTNDDQVLQSNTPSPSLESQRRGVSPTSALQPEENQRPKTKKFNLRMPIPLKPGALRSSLSASIGQSKNLKPMNLFAATTQPRSQPTKVVANTHQNSQQPQPHVAAHTQQKPQPTKVPQNPQPNPQPQSNLKSPFSANPNIEETSQPLNVHASPYVSQSCHDIPPIPSVRRTSISPTTNDGVQEHMTESDDSDDEPLHQGNDQDNLKKSRPSKPRCMKTRNVVPDWSDDIIFDEKEEVLTIDAENNHKILSGSIQPRDIDNLEDEVRCIVHFNDFNQPLRKGGFVLVKYLGSLAKIERFCPIGEKSWHKVNKYFKAEIVKRVRNKFIIPAGEIFDRAILMRVGKALRQYKYTLKMMKFNPDKRTKEKIFDDVPLGHTRANWVRLVEQWYSEENKKLSKLGREARASQSHVHTTGSISYANKRADFVESKGKQPSNLELYQLTHTKVVGGFVENTVTSKLLEEANSKVEELVRTSSPSKSRTEIENEVFDGLMYEDDNPKRPVGFGFGVKKSQVFGVHSILRRGGYESATTTSRSIEMQNMRAKMSSMEKENQELRARVDQSNARVDQNSQIMLQALDAIRSGKFNDEFYETLHSALRGPNSQISSAASDNSTHDGLGNPHI